MTDFARLGIVVESDSVRRSRHELDRLTRTGGQTEARLSRSMQALGSSFRSVAVQAAGMVTAVVGVGTALRSSQEIVEVRNAFRGMGMTAAEAEQALDEVAGVAQRTRAPLRETAELYRRVSVASRDLGASSEDVVRFTENVGLALASSGTSAQEASGALLQLSQAMAGGIVRAEEFNSILEGAFPIAQAAADGIDRAGGSVGRLRQLVVAGEVSSREFFDAILSQSDALEEAFGNTIPTVSQALTVLSASVGLVTFGMDDATGASALLANAILGLSSGVTAAAAAVGEAKRSLDDFLSSLSPLGNEVDSLRVLVSGAASVIVGMYTPAIYGAVTATVRWAASLVTLRGALISTGIGALVVGAGLLIDYLINLRRSTGSWGEALSALGDLAAGVWAGIATSAQGISPALSAIWADVQSSFFGFLSLMTEQWSRFLGGLGSDLAGISVLGVNPFQGVSDALLDASNKAVGEMSQFDAEAQSAANSAASLRREAANLATEGFDKAREAAERLADIVSSSSDVSNDASDAAHNLKQALNEIGSESGAASKAAKKVKEVGDEAERSGAQLAGIFDGAIRNADSLTEALGRVIQKLLEMAAIQALEGAFTSLAGNGTGGLLSGSIIPGILHDGGVAGKDGYNHSRSFPASAFVGAPRYHNGGVAGLRPNEVPAVLEKGETVIPKGGFPTSSGAPSVPKIEVVAWVDEGGNIKQIIRSESDQIAVRRVTEGLDQFSRHGLPQRLDQLRNSPHVRG